MIRFLAPVLVLSSLAACSQAPAPTVDRSPTAQVARTAGPGEYLVKRGDTLYRIARENGMDHNELAAMNNITDPTSLREGQILRLRRVDGAAAGATTAVTVATPVGIGGGVEARPLDAPAAVPAPAVSGNSLREPRGGKEPYSDEANARLNSAPAPVQPPPVATAPAAPAATPAQAPAETAASAPAATAQVEGITWAWPTSAKIQTPYNGSSNKGIDFAGRLGDPVLAVADGRVLYVGEALAGYGKLVIVKHGANHLSVYAHNSRILVKEAQTVKLGQKIAEMGSTGSNAVKLHFEIRKQGKPVDPAPFLPAR